MSAVNKLEPTKTQDCWRRNKSELILFNRHRSACSKKSNVATFQDLYNCRPIFLICYVYWRSCQTMFQFQTFYYVFSIIWYLLVRWHRGLVNNLMTWPYAGQYFCNFYWTSLCNLYYKCHDFVIMQSAESRNHYDLKYIS